MFKGKATRTYQNSIEGIWGDFVTSAGRVSFIQTKARLGSISTDNERRLTSQLHPVREVLPTEKMDFNQLLQRDLDDHRVAEQLIPYLLKPKPTGPAFFPPIMAVLLPFKDSRPTEAFPSISHDGLQEDKDIGVMWQEQQFGDAYAFRKLAQENGAPNEIKLGKLLWNDEHGRLVVLDGQHRAMALIAIDRTISGTWSGSKGNRYRHFYEKRVSELIKEAGATFSLDRVEIPVTICWFPEQDASKSDPHKAARKLFVDVNKEARTPSEARLTLLSDSHLLNILTRSLLNRLRDTSPPLPLYAIEYDNPERDSARPVRWSVLTNLNLLKFATQRCIFGPKKLLTDFTASFGGRPPASEMDAFMRLQLGTDSLFEDTISDGERTIERDLLGNENFPLKHVDKIVDRFLSSWGMAILTILGSLRPYESHWKALESLKNGWHSDDSFSSLAQEALFGGVGMFWTLKNSFHHWLDAEEFAHRHKDSEPPRPDIVKAWLVLEGKASEFRELRAYEYLGKKSGTELEKADRFYETANTHACQLGAILTFATLAHATGKGWQDVASFADRIVTAWNAALDSKRTSSESRRLIFARDPVIANPINRLGKMDTTFALYFRYFWLELLRLKSAQELLQGTVDKTKLEELTADARVFYIGYLVEERIKALRFANPGITDEKARRQAEAGIQKEFAKALQHWFEYNAEEAQATVTAALKPAVRKEPNVDAENPAEDSGPAEVKPDESSPDSPDSEESSADSPGSVDDLLATLSKD